VAGEREGQAVLMAREHLRRNDSKPQYEPQMEMEEQVDGDDEQHVGVEPEPGQLDYYLLGHTT